MKKLLGLLVVVAATLSCSSDDSTSGGNPTTFPMNAVVDAFGLSMQPETGGNFSDPSGGMFSSDYHELEGFKIVLVSGKTELKEYKYYIRLAIPKINPNPGTYAFSYAQLPDGYFADLHIEAVENDNGENEVTKSGEIKVTSYDSSTRRIIGTFAFKTSDGVSPDDTHVVSGGFNYILAPEL